MEKERSILTYIALMSAVLFWGLSFVATKVALRSFTPFCLIFFRFFAASLFFIILFWRTGFHPISRKNWKAVLLLAIMQPGLYFSFETIGLQYTSATKTSLIIATIPVVVLTFSALFLKERAGIINFIGIVLSLAGVAMLVFGNRGDIELGGMFLGDFLIFGAVLSASVYMILTRSLASEIPARQITGMQIIIGAILFFPAFLWDLPKFSWEAVTSEALVALVGLTVFATIGAFLCYNYALTKIPAAKASVCINGIPLVTAFAAWFLLGESLSPVQFAGAGIVLVAVLIANHSPKDIPAAKH